MKTIVDLNILLHGQMNRSRVIKKAVDLYGNQKVLVCATPITVKGKKMLDLVERVDKDHLVDLVALPKLVRFAEKQEFNSDEVLAYLKEALSKFDFKEYGSLVLGCTHYPLIKKQLNKVLNNPNFFDGGHGISMQLKRTIEKYNIKKTKNKIEFFDSSNNKFKKERFFEMLNSVKF